MLGPTVLPQLLEQGFHASLAAMVASRPGRHETVPSGSISMAHLDDVAALFLAAYEQENAQGRYFAVTASWTWAAIYEALGVGSARWYLAPHVPQTALPKPPADPPEDPTRFDFTRRDSLGVTFRDIPTKLAQTVEWLEQLPFD